MGEALAGLLRLALRLQEQSRQRRECERLEAIRQRERWEAVSRRKAQQQRWRFVRRLAAAMEEGRQVVRFAEALERETPGCADQDSEPFRRWAADIRSLAAARLPTRLSLEGLAQRTEGIKEWDDGEKLADELLALLAIS